MSKAELISFYEDLVRRLKNDEYNEGQIYELKTLMEKILGNSFSPSNEDDFEKMQCFTTDEINTKDEVEEHELLCENHFC